MFKHLKQDLPASLVVFLVALPLCLGIALASGAPPLAGLIAGILGGLLVAPISGSQVGVSGPAAGLAVIVLNGINSLQRDNPVLLTSDASAAYQIAVRTPTARPPVSPSPDPPHRATPAGTTSCSISYATAPGATA